MKLAYKQSNGIIAIVYADHGRTLNELSANSRTSRPMKGMWSNAQSRMAPPI